ncbi:MAG: hypothetical protein K8R75_02600 [Deltaproteobacteria bacterium]|nr:hypothetical protein [Deltaproteobacteria bacterium]
MEMEQQYSELLHNSAEKWGLNILPGRPLIGLVPCSRRPDGIIENPYQPKPISIVETFVYRGEGLLMSLALLGLGAFIGDYMMVVLGIIIGIINLLIRR